MQNTYKDEKVAHTFCWLKLLQMESNNNWWVITMVSKTETVKKIGKEIGSQFLSFLLDQFRVQFLIELDGLIIF